MAVLDSALVSILVVINMALGFYLWILIASAVLSWLLAFGVVNQYNRFVRIVGDFCYRLTEPVLRPIRRFVPPMGGLDLAPLILIFLIVGLQTFFGQLATRL
jgi:YggT family protein